MSKKRKKTTNCCLSVIFLSTNVCYVDISRIIWKGDGHSFLISSTKVVGKHEKVIIEAFLIKLTKILYMKEKICAEGI